MDRFKCLNRSIKVPFTHLFEGVITHFIPGFMSFPLGRKSRWSAHEFSGVPTAQPIKSTLPMAGQRIEMNVNGDAVEVSTSIAAAAGLKEKGKVWDLTLPTWRLFSCPKSQQSLPMATNYSPILSTSRSPIVCEVHSIRTSNELSQCKP